MAITLPPLPYELNELEPYISAETMSYHYGKHHKTYVDKCNELIKSTLYKDLRLEDIIIKTANKDGKDKKIYNNASQAWNHTFFWNCMTPHRQKKQPSGAFHKAIETHFKNLEDFMNKFSQSAVEIFGSGWNWLVKNHDGSLSIVSYSNAESPLAHGQVPLLTCDFWEHAYYLDYKNDRKSFVTNFWTLVDWQFVEMNYEKYTAFDFTAKKEDFLSVHH